MEHRLTIKEKCGYGSAAIGDAVCYTLPGTYMLFFLTTVAGIQPAVAGAITAVAAVWDAIWNPIVGYLSDHHRSRHGRRRPFMACFVGPLVVATILLFTNLDMAPGIKIVYYGLMCIVFWTCFTGFFVPFYALGTQYSDDYDERTLIRAYASFFNMFGTVISMAMPSVLIQELQSRGMSLEHSWTVMVSICAVISGISIVITVISSKDKDVCDENSMHEETGAGPLDMLKDFRDVLRFQPVICVIVACLFVLIAYAFLASDMMYYLTYNMGFDGKSTSMALLFRALIGMALIPVGTWLCKKTDNRTALIIFFLIGITGLLIIRAFGTYTVLTLLLLMVVACSCTAFYWQIMPVLVYELCVYDEYVTGKKREGVMVSLQGLIETIAAGIGTQLLGLVLQFAGFDGEAAAQTPMAESWIFSCTTIVPAIFMALSVAALVKYPISRGKFNEMRRSLEQRKD